MDKLRRVIVPRSETGYMFSIKDLGYDYSEVAPVSKVIMNGPAYSAGLRPGDGLVAINSNLVKGKSHMDLCNIIKSCGISLELTVIENYFTSISPHLIQNKSMSTDDRKRTTNNSTPLSIEEESLSESPIIIKKKAYTYDKAEFDKFTNLDEEVPNQYNSSSDLCSEKNSRNDFIHLLPINKFQPVKPKISYKPAKNNGSTTATAKSDMEIDMIGKSSSSIATDNSGGSIVNAKLTQYNRSKLVYHYAYKQSNKKSSLNNKLMIDSQQTNHGIPDRRGSSPSMSDSNSLKSANKQPRFTNAVFNPAHLYRKSSHASQISKSNYPTSSPKLSLNRVGGLVRAPLSMDETFDLDNEADHSDMMLYSVETGITDHSSETGATNESGRSSCDLDNLEISGKPKYRHLHCSPVPYKSSSITTSSSLPLEVTPKNETSQSQLKLIEDVNTKITKKCSLIRTNSQSESFNVDEIDHGHLYQCEPNPDSSMEDYCPDKEELIVDGELKFHHSSKHFKKLKNILCDNYRGRSKTLDSDRKLKEEDKIDYCPVFANVKWSMYEGKPSKCSWKQYKLDMDEDRLVFIRETNLTSNIQASVDETNMTIPLCNATVDEEPEKRGRKNTLKIINSEKQSECFIEFTEKSLANKWLFALAERIKPEKDDKTARSASFKERHSLTVPNLYSKESPVNQNQFKTKIKNKENSQSNANPTTGIPITFPQTNKSVIQQTMSRVKKLKHKFASSSHVSEFERQQEEWFNRSTVQCKLVGSSSCSEDFHGSLDGSSSAGQMNFSDSKQQMQSLEYGHTNLIPLHKWQRSITSCLIPLAVELCISIIENFGMNHVGLYRVSGNKIALDYICAELRKPVSEIDVTTDKWNDLHAISGVLKSFFRNLSDGLFPKDLYSDIIGACRIHECDRERRLLSIQRFLSIMDIAQDHPEYRYHRETLRYLMEHLSRVTSRQATNRMNARNLAVIFAPTLMKPPQETNEILVNDYKYKIQLIETLIKHHKWLFSPTLESACNVPPDFDDDDIVRSPPPEDLLFPIDLNENKDTDTGITDARPLVKEILEKAKNLIKENHETVENFSFSDEGGKTLAELSREAYVFNSFDIGYKEVDIDEECEKRKCTNDGGPVAKLKSTTDQILFSCSRDISELKDIQQHCRDDLCDIKGQIQKIDREISKTEKVIESIPEKSSKKMVSRLYEIPSKNLSNLSMVLATPNANQIESHSVDSGSQKIRLSSTEV